MPTIYKYRHWCVNCQAWELFSRPIMDKGDIKCEVCDSPIQDGVTFGDIPDELIIEQRKRYAEYKHQRFLKTLNAYMHQGNNLLDMFREDYNNVEIIEHDAGQDKIDANKRMEKERIRRENKEEAMKYVGLGRNEKCRCGSGLKYKKCCLHRVEQLKF